MPDGTPTPLILDHNIVDEVLGNKDRNTGKISFDNLVANIMARVGPSYETYAELAADLEWSARSLAVVYDDDNAALNGLYKKVDAISLGSWTRIGDSAVSAAVVAAQTAQAIAETKAARAGVMEIKPGAWHITAPQGWIQLPALLTDTAIPNSNFFVCAIVAIDITD